LKPSYSQFIPRFCGPFSVLCVKLISGTGHTASSYGNNFQSINRVSWLKTCTAGETLAGAHCKGPLRADSLRKSRECIPNVWETQAQLSSYVAHGRMPMCRNCRGVWSRRIIHHMLSAMLSHCASCPVVNSGCSVQILILARWCIDAHLRLLGRQRKIEAEAAVRSADR
jgi:hypothetical protein